MAVTGLKVSKKIEEFVLFYDEAMSIYKYCFDMVNECDKLKCDLLHKLELGLYQDKNEKRRLLTQLEYCLKDRRYYKDRVEELEPFAGLWLNKSKENVMKSCKEAINNIKNCLGNVRKQEEYHSDRKYKPRVLKDLYNEI